MRGVYDSSVSSTPEGFVVPPGMKLVPDGQLTESISFRVTPVEGERLLALRDTFTPRQWAVTFRWLLTQPEVDELIRARIAQSLNGGP